ncbi:MAG TPA: NIPSNAP family protein [Steroidobacteraceae bacterium]|nr:NIPSNAP family protein [Steroidobacteraceae bacterium]
MSKHSWAFLVAGLVLGAGLTQLRAAEPAVAAAKATAPAAAPARVFEIRTYHCFPGRLDALNKRFREHTMKMFEKHGMTNVAYWTFEDSPAKENTLIYVISHASREQAAKNWDEFRNDPEWKAIAAASEADGGKIVEKVDSVFVDATDYSPMK